MLDEPRSLRVVGKIPNYVRGALIRAGPTITETETKNFTNFLDGFGRVTKWDLDGEDNSATYLSSIIRSNLYNSSFVEGKPSTIARHITQ